MLMSQEMRRQKNKERKTNAIDGRLKNAKKQSLAYKAVNC